MKKIIFIIITILSGLMIIFQPADQVEANVDEAFYGVQVTRLENRISQNYVPFAFDAVNYGLHGMWSPADPTRITIPISGIWEVGAEITTLGLNYVAIGGTPNDRVIINILKNWDGLQSTFLVSTICAERFEPQNVYAANLNTTSCAVVLEVGDTIQLVLIGRGNLLVESNPHDSGIISPHFNAEYLGSE